MELDGSELLQIIPSGKRKSVVNFIAVYTIYIHKKCESQGGIKSRRIVKVSRTRPLRLSIVSTLLNLLQTYYSTHFWSRAANIAKTDRKIYLEMSFR